jgi:hypothetical protein
MDPDEMMAAMEAMEDGEEEEAHADELYNKFSAKLKMRSPQSDLQLQLQQQEQLQLQSAATFNKMGSERRASITPTLPPEIPIRPGRNSSDSEEEEEEKKQEEQEEQEESVDPDEMMAAMEAMEALESMQAMETTIKVRRMDGEMQPPLDPDPSPLPPPNPSNRPGRNSSDSSSDEGGNKSYAEQELEKSMEIHAEAQLQLTDTQAQLTALRLQAQVYMVEARSLGAVKSDSDDALRRCTAAWEAKKEQSYRAQHEAIMAESAADLIDSSKEEQGHEAGRGSSSPPSTTTRSLQPQSKMVALSQATAAAHQMQSEVEQLLFKCKKGLLMKEKTVKTAGTKTRMFALQGEIDTGICWLSYESEKELQRGKASKAVTRQANWAAKKNVLLLNANTAVRLGNSTNGEANSAFVVEDEKSHKTWLLRAEDEQQMLEWQACLRANVELLGGCGAPLDRIAELFDSLVHEHPIPADGPHLSEEGSKPRGWRQKQRDEWLNRLISASTASETSIGGASGLLGAEAELPHQVLADLVGRYVQAEAAASCGGGVLMIDNRLEMSTRSVDSDSEAIATIRSLNRSSELSGANRSTSSVQEQEMASQKREQNSTIDKARKLERSAIAAERQATSAYIEAKERVSETMLAYQRTILRLELCDAKKKELTQIHESLQSTLHTTAQRESALRRSIDSMVLVREERRQEGSARKHPLHSGYIRWDATPPPLSSAPGAASTRNSTAGVGGSREALQIQAQLRLQVQNMTGCALKAEDEKNKVKAIVQKMRGGLLKLSEECALLKRRVKSMEAEIKKHKQTEKRDWDERKGAVKGESKVEVKSKGKAKHKGEKEVEVLLADAIKKVVIDHEADRRQHRRHDVEEHQELELLRQQLHRADEFNKQKDRQVSTLLTQLHRAKALARKKLQHQQASEVKQRESAARASAEFQQQQAAVIRRLQDDLTHARRRLGEFTRRQRQQKDKSSTGRERSGKSSWKQSPKKRCSPSRTSPPSGSIDTLSPMAGLDMSERKYTTNSLSYGLSPPCPPHPQGMSMCNSMPSSTMDLMSIAGQSWTSHRRVDDGFDTNEESEFGSDINGMMNGDDLANGRGGCEDEGGGIGSGIGHIDPSVLEAEMQMEEGSLLVSMISQALQ